MSLCRATVLFAALLLAACGSSPETHYFALAPVPGNTQRPAALGTPLSVAAVHIPPSLDRQEMVRRTSANAVEVSDQDRWSAPLGDMARTVLSQDLASRLPKSQIILPNAPAPPRTAEVVVSLAEFGPDGQGRTTLEGSWSLLKSGQSQPALHRDFAFATAATAPGSGEAAAMSTLLGRLATEIAGTVRDALGTARGLAPRG
ncbi:MAG: PqiC family protein [Stellaceae bacterium]